jgi:peptidoglycan hydrolase-like protein with peptidoglycan-binding domain
VARRVVVGICVLVGVFLGTGNGAFSQDIVPSSDSADATPSSVDPVSSTTPAARPDPQENRPDRARRDPTLLGPGDTGRRVRELQARLKQIEWYFDRVTGSYDAATERAVSGFQRKRGFAVTGEVNRRTWDRLLEMTWEPTQDELHNRIPGEMIPGPLDPRCLTGRVMCVDKSTYSLRWVVDGEVLMTFDVRFGAEATPTREGEFAVSYMSADHVSTLYDTAMPYAMFFSGGQAVHYSPDFAAVGYAGASHGCVNVRDYDGIAKLFDQVRLGDKVVVYWS